MSSEFKSFNHLKGFHLIACLSSRWNIHIFCIFLSLLFRGIIDNYYLTLQWNKRQILFFSKFLFPHSVFHSAFFYFSSFYSDLLFVFPFLLINPFLSPLSSSFHPSLSPLHFPLVRFPSSSGISHHFKFVSIFSPNDPWTGCDERRTMRTACWLFFSSLSTRSSLKREIF